MRGTLPFCPIVSNGLGGIESRQEFLVQLLGSMSDSAFLAEMTGRVVFFNRPAAEMLEVSDVEMGSLDLFSIIRECLRSKTENLSNLIIRNGGRIRAERVEVVGYAGRSSYALLSVDVIPGAKPTEMMFLATLRDNGEAERLTHGDPLTGIFNRRFFDYKVEEEYSRLKRGQHDELSLLFLDVDFFGAFNKEYGHRFGDAVLRVVARTMSDTARLSDSVCRYGGEEFVVILPGTDSKGAIIFAERVRRAVADLRLRHPETFKEVGVTVSIGVSTHVVNRPATAGQLIEESNHALLESKRRGRNRVLAFEDIGN